MTTNNHPAHSTLTPRRLHQMRDILSKASAQRDGGDIGYAMSDAVKLIDEALAARAVTVKLPAGYSIRTGHPINEPERGVMIPKDGGTWLSRFDVEHALRVAGVGFKEE
ncbi:hypothetical protein [Escherichia coli]|uniref:hypothetical protein n=1 Tax=Escherichia coli TaxID=562 RepID=UPI0039C8CBEA